MPRPHKPRTVCQMPENLRYGPEDENNRKREQIVLPIDEYETLRLIDYEGYTQEEAAQQMQVARTTVQRIYNDARHKVADAIVNGKKIFIAGGNYHICQPEDPGCARPCRLHHRNRGRL
ncbi:MAG: DUF134 domain-containing protein [Candidatus Izemoplasmatales bacterium]|nr:DUF134 domain-containing protein [Candidatus Izemoplasmatales bacterium]MDD5293875.1 DUF134 domain-containing protein [Candidatus Izemoplasmatales bacterium]